MNLLWPRPAMAVGQCLECYCYICKSFYSNIGSVPNHQPEEWGYVSFLVDTFTGWMHVACHQKHLVLIFDINISYLCYYYTFLPGRIPSNLDFIFVCRTPQKGQKSNYAKMLRLWNKEKIGSHGLRTNKGIHIGYRPPPLLMHHLCAKHWLRNVMLRYCCPDAILDAAFHQPKHV